jgi:acyl carrier protein phosphodiesterase
MNYLAHIFLSGNLAQRQLGNFIGDFVKGNHYDKYPTELKKGILLHRKIDSFTDQHPIFRETVAFMRPTFGRYSGIVLDMYFDYFLALNFQQFSPKQNLNQLSFRFYCCAAVHYLILPQKVKGFIWHFIGTHRLKKYASLEGLLESFQIMEYSKTPAIHSEPAIQFLVSNVDFLQHQFLSFFPDLISYVEVENK